MLCATSHVPLADLDPDLLDDVWAGVRALVAARLPSGNLPSKLGSREDR